MCKILPLTQRDQSSQYCLRKGFFHKNIDIFTHTPSSRRWKATRKFHAT
jgi:heterodisulfide reductase subunit A